MDDGMTILERLIRTANVRHKVLSSNIANTDTPGYQARDVDFRKVLEAETGELRTTNPRHLQAGGIQQGAAAPGVDPGPAWGDRNTVELDMEIAKMTENALLYQAGVKLLSSKMKIFRNAIRGR